MTLDEIATEVHDAGTKLIQLAADITSEGYRLQEVSQEISSGSTHPNRLVFNIAEVRRLADKAQWDINDAAAMIARTPHKDDTFD